MKDKLPKIYANKIDKELKNNEKVYSSSLDNKVEEKPKKNKQETIIQKINKILNSKNHIYKIPVKITMIEPEQEVITKMIGKNKTNIITIDNQLIEIKNIKNIEINEEKNE